MESQPAYEDCPDCDRGRVEVPLYHRQSFDQDSGYIETRTEDCERCEGEGRVVICEDCTDGWIYFERPVSLGHGPSEHWTYETWREPCESCEKGRQNDER